jgi:cell division protease FtsH
MMQHSRDYSEEMARIIDEEVKSLVDEAHSKALSILRENRETLDRVTNALVERETITGEEFEKLVKGEELPPLFRKESDSKPTKPEAEKDPDKKKSRAPRLGDILDGPRQVPG